MGTTTAIQKIPTGPTVPWIATVWRQHFEEAFKAPAPALTKRDFAQLEILRNKLGPATLIVIEWAIANWSAFAQHAVTSNLTKCPTA